MLGNTGKIQNAGTRVFSSGYAQDRGAAPKGGVQDYETDRGQYEKQEEVQAFCGAAVLLRKSILDKIGLFDETFFLYYEDVELSERARKTDTGSFTHQKQSLITNMPPQAGSGLLFLYTIRNADD
jgi:GT2 family glycosyltransferase